MENEGLTGVISLQLQQRVLDIISDRHDISGTHGSTDGNSHLIHFQIDFDTC